MKKLKFAAIFSLWICLFTICLIYTWSHNPDLVPVPPQDFSIWLANLFNVENGEQLADIELLFMAVNSFIVALISSVTVVYIFKKSTDKKV